MKITTLNNGAAIDEKQFMTWLAALRSGKYKQAKGTLQNENGYCCLGVACEILIPEDKQEKSFMDKYLIGKMPISQTNSPLWLRNLNYDFSKRANVELTQLNDGANLEYVDAYDIETSETQTLTFEEIADVLEAVYVDGILEGEEV
jgi:hypothetical protein